MLFRSIIIYDRNNNLKQLSLQFSLNQFLLYFMTGATIIGQRLLNMAVRILLAPVSVLLLALYIFCILQKFRTHKDKDWNVLTASKLPIGTSVEAIYCLISKSGRSTILNSSAFDDRVNRILLYVLFLSGDIELNPGPTEYPCGVCQHPVRINQQAVRVCCDECNLWHHTRCMNMSS